MRAISILALFASGCVWVCSSAELYEAPWPDERLRAEDGSVDISLFPEGTGSPMRDVMVAMLEGRDGFGLASAVYFPLGVRVDAASLPSVQESTQENASVFLLNIDPSSPERGQRMPIDVRFAQDGGPFGVPNLLSALPYPGIPLAPSTLYAAVVTTRVRDADGNALARRGSPNVVGIDPSTIASAAVFRTGDPIALLREARERAPAIQPGELALVEEHDEYCVFATTVRMPVLQRGEPPYLLNGGAWDPALEVQREEDARMFVTVPRSARAAYPAAVFVRTGGGGDRPLIDRGPRDASGASIPGSGPAVQIARAGFVGVMVDGPLGGARNRANWDEQFVVMNTINLVALEGNVLQSALELALVARSLERLAIDASACEGASASVRIDTSRLALIGHSMGAQIAPLAAAVEPRYGAMIVSGAGASWIRQVMFKQSPVPARTAAEAMLGYPLYSRALTEHDPILSLLQWSGERSDPAIYGRAILAREVPLHVLVFQGLLDTYIPPPIANAYGLSLDVDLAGPALDEQYPEYTPLRADLELRGGTILPLPVRGNRGATRVVVQHPEDGIEDGHEVLFQRTEAQEQLRCFLASFAHGTPVVVDPAEPCAP